MSVLIFGAPPRVRYAPDLSPAPSPADSRPCDTAAAAASVTSVTRPRLSVEMQLTRPHAAPASAPLRRLGRLVLSVLRRPMPELLQRLAGGLADRSQQQEDADGGLHRHRSDINNIDLPGLLVTRIETDLFAIP
jgi:hypothetical protein